MTLLFWSLPILLAAVLVGSGRLSSVGAGFCGALTAAMVGLMTAPRPFGPAEALTAAAHGAWLAILVGAVILGGLFFREAVAGGGETTVGETPPPLRRRRLFTTCFLIGPFAEAATGFGVGQVTTMPALRSLGLMPLQVVLFGLFSQTMVPWGALGNGTIVGAQLAGLAPADLGVRSALLTLPMLLVWLLLFWRLARQAGVPGQASAHLAEILWLLLAGALLVGANAALGPEVAGLAALGPLIALRFLLHERPDRAGWRAALRIGLPFGALILALAATRGIPPLGRALAEALAIRPLAGAPALYPLLHPAFWLVVVGIAAALLLGRGGMIGIAAQRAWTGGRKPGAAILCFLVMAQVMAEAGMAAGLGEGLRRLLGGAAPLATPLLAGLFGLLTSSGNATNGLLMPSQIALAAATGVDPAWLAAILNTAGAALTMLSPVRLAMGCALVGRPDLERPVYARAWPMAAVALAVLLAAAAAL